mmetsp:Transcript_123969/g.396312  ORF Transcript_123969/g.396312 Transcript_123969/m.396312 type:complete len:218 (-) Transcript_123969:104-757(-)
MHWCATSTPCSRTRRPRPRRAPREVASALRMASTVRAFSGTRGVSTAHAAGGRRASTGTASKMASPIGILPPPMGTSAPRSIGSSRMRPLRCSSLPLTSRRSTRRSPSLGSSRRQRRRVRRPLVLSRPCRETERCKHRSSRAVRRQLTGCTSRWTRPTCPTCTDLQLCEPGLRFASPMCRDCDTQWVLTSICVYTHVTCGLRCPTLQIMGMRESACR